MKKTLFLSSVIILMLFSCKKEITIPNNGIYRGVFNQIHNGTDTVTSGVAVIALFESNSVYNLVGDSLTHAPATHGGGYLVVDSDKIDFSSNPVSGGVYNFNHYLDTIYSYFFDDVNFNFWLERDTILYEYKLVRF